MKKSILLLLVLWLASCAKQEELPHSTGFVASTDVPPELEQFIKLDSSVRYATKQVTVTGREACSYTCPNNFVVSVVPYSKSTCNCLKGFLEWEGAGGTQTRQITRLSNGASQGYTGFGTICDSSHLQLCLQFANAGGSAVCGEGNCFSGLVLVQAVGTPLYQFPFCTELPTSGYLCIDLGTVNCCLSGNSGCYLSANGSYNTNFVECGHCGDGYDCTF